MNDHQLAARSLDRKDFDCNAGVVIAEEHPAVWFGWIIRWRLIEGQAAMPNDVANLIITYAVPAGGLENSDRQRLTSITVIQFITGDMRWLKRRALVEVAA